MSILPPTITLPFSGSDFTTNVEVQEFRGTAESGTIQVYVNGSAIGVDFDLNTLEWSYTSQPLNEGANIFTFKSFDGIAFSSEISQQITFTPAETIESTIQPPTGIGYRAYINFIDVTVQQSLAVRPAQIPVGYNFYYSTTPSSNFLKLNTEPVRTPSEVVRTVLETNEETLPDQTLVEFEQLGGTFVKKSVVRTEVYQEVGRFVFRHTPTSRVPLDTRVPAYYFVTAVYYDAQNRREIESVPSEEIVARAIVIDTTIRGLPQRTRSDISTDYIDYVYQTDPSLDLSPGSIVREIYIEPFSVELEKALFLADFYSRTQSFVTLVQIDDADGDGISDPVSSSLYKQRLKVALGFVSDEEVQRVIDEAFRKLAANLNVPPQRSSRARGFVVLQVANLVSDIFVSRGAVFSTTPDQDLGIPAIFFVSEVSTQMLRSRASEYFNPSTGFFELTIPVIAQDPGSQGNVGPGLINRIVSGVTGTALVSNTSSTTFGSDEEGNIALAERSLLAFVGADSGTRGGYLFNTLKVGGVINAKVVGGGDPLMVRDLIPVAQNSFSELRGLPAVKHVWGTVDIYVQAVGLASATETFAVFNPRIEEERFNIESTTLLQFSTNNIDVTQDTPISEVLRVVNFTRDEEYDLTNLSIIGGRVIVLDPTLPTNQEIGICDTDIVRVDYRYQAKKDFVFTNQPVEGILSVTGELSGDLSNNFNLYRRSHPLYEGMSTKAGDYLSLFSANGKPSAELQTTEDLINMIEEYPVPLSRAGILENTIVVTSLDGATVYQENVDYVILRPSEENPRLRVRRRSSGSIPNASQVLVSFEHGENISVTYTYQAVPRRVAESLEEFRHITADVLVKNSLRSPVNIEAILVKRPGFSDEVTDFNVRSAVNRFFSGLKMGDAIHESDIVAIMDNTDAVDFVVVPLTLLNRADNTLIMDEPFPNATWSVLNSDISTSYISDSPILQYKTVDKGGNEVSLGEDAGKEFRIVGVRDEYVIYNQVSSEFEVSRGFGRSYIRADGRVVVSTQDGSDPTGRDLRGTYYTFGETGSRSIFAAPNEVLILGTLNLRILSLAALNAGQ